MVACTAAYAQHTETELVRSVFKLEKKAMVAEFLKLSNDDAAKFWPIYEKYEAERSTLGSRRIALIDTYATKYEAMDDASADALVKESASIQKKEVVLREKYYAQVRKAVSTGVAARFYQIEDAINVGVRMELYEQIPMLQGK
jgi:Spy/CpxP family protein refolding chaperone